MELIRLDVYVVALLDWRHETAPVILPPHKF